jgi:serine/threonine protein kinase
VPHTTAYTGAFQDSKQIYIVMEHCSGGDLLEQLLREGRAMAEKRVVREVVLPTLTALAYLHAAGIIHRCVLYECDLLQMQSRAWHLLQETACRSSSGCSGWAIAATVGAAAGGGAMLDWVAALQFVFRFAEAAAHSNNSTCAGIAVCVCF